MSVQILAFSVDCWMNLLKIIKILDFFNETFILSMCFFFKAIINDQFLPDTHPKRILLFLYVEADNLKKIRFWNCPRAFGGSGFGSRSD